MAVEEIVFPVPQVTDEDRAYWDGVQAGKLLIQKCLDCNHLQFFPRPRCVSCFSKNLGWQESKGTGTVYSFTTVSIPLNPAVRKHVEQGGAPPIFAKIDLDEGVRIISEIIDCQPEEVKIGAPVQVAYVEAKGTNFKLPKFRLVG